MNDRLQSNFAKGRHASQPPAGHDGPAARQLLAIVDASLCGIVLIAPLFFGGRHDLGRFVFVLFTALAAGAWFIRQALLPSARWVRTAAHGLLLLAVGLVALQLVPLPAAWIDALAPRAAEMLSLWTGGDAAVQLGTWRTLSLIPHETAKSLAMLISYGLLFVVVAQRIRDTADVRRLLRWISLSAVLMASFGLVQFFTSNGRYFWFYEHPFRTTSQSVTGSFMNRNHCAGFLVLGIGPLVGWLVAAMRDSTGKAARRTAATTGKRAVTPLLAAGLAIVVLATLMSLSRGGAVALLIAATTVVALYWRRRLVDVRYLYGLAGLVIAVIAMLSLYGYDQVAARLDDFTEGSVDVMDPAEGRRIIWRANLAAVQDGWQTGAGAGSHREIYPVYLQQPLAKEYTHAENGYLQVATETGLIGAGLLLAGLGLCGYWCIACYRRAGSDGELLYCGATAAGLAAIAVHSLVDFVWYIPACMSFTVILAACMLRLSQLALAVEDRRRTRYVPGRPVWATLATIAVLAGAWTISTFAGPAIAAVHWDRYLRGAVADAKISQQLLSEFVTGYDSSVVRLQRPLSDSMIHQLEQAVYWEPQMARAHARLADRYMTRFELRLRDNENTMEVTQIRDAALASAFASPEELRRWLDRAFGADAQLLYRALDHAHRAVELCPLQGDGYLYLADLCFLEGAPNTTVQAYVDQGLRVRPYDKGVLYRAGVQALSFGHIEETLRLWSRCYDVAGSHQAKIVYRLVASGMPASLFVSTFQPDWQTLRDVWARYRQFGSDEDLTNLLSYAAEATQRETQQPQCRRPAFIWFWQSLMYSDMGQAEESLACLERAYTLNPRHFGIRYALGQALLAAGRYAEAEPHVRWCRARRPENKNLSAALVEIAKRRLAEAEQNESPTNRGIGAWRQ